MGLIPEEQLVKEYLSGRQKYARPQGLIFTESYFFENNFFYPYGEEYVDYIVLSDHNREEISIDLERIETRKRMINGRMRSVWLADKRKISTSWKDLPSRAASSLLDVSGGELVIKEDEPGKQGRQFVVDKGAAAYDLAKWHKDHPGTFWVLLAFDQQVGLNGYTVAIECFFDSFEYSISKRGATMDFWDVGLSLEEA